MCTVTEDNRLLRSRVPHTWVSNRWPPSTSCAADTIIKPTWCETLSLGGLLLSQHTVYMLKAQRWTSGLLSTFQKGQLFDSRDTSFFRIKEEPFETQNLFWRRRVAFDHTCQFNQCYGLIFEQAWSLDDIQTKQSLHLADAPGCESNSWFVSRQ